MSLRIVMLGLLALAGATRADDAMVLGSNPDLVAGAEALMRGRFEEGVALTQAGLAMVVSGEDRSAGLSNLCAGYTALGQYDLAIIHCSESLAIDPNRWQAYSNRALAWLGKGMLRRARRDVTRGLELNPMAQRLLQVAVLVEEAASRRDHRDPDPIA